MKIKIPDDIFERIEEENFKEAQAYIEKGLFEKAEDIGVVTLIRSGIMTQLNPMGKIIWDNLKSLNTITAVAQKISAEFDISYDQCFNDIKIFVEELVEKGFLINE